MLLWLFSQKMHIFVAGCEALLDIPGILLTTNNGYNSEGGQNLEAEIAWVQGSFESIEEASFKDGIIGVEHVNDIKGDVLCVRVLRGTEWHG
jgi:hypothetical protein